MSTIKFGLIGCGRIGTRHAEEINKTGILKAVCDINSERAGSISGKYSAKAYSSLDDLLLKEKDINVISVCTPNGLHAEHTIKSLHSGFHVLCEKPMAISVMDCKDMIDEAEASHKHLFIVKQNRFNPPIVALRKALTEGKLGKIFNVQLNCFWNRNENYYKNSEWKGTKALDGGVLYTQFSHFIDLLYWLVGDIKEVSAFTGNFAHKDLIEFEDTGSVIIEFFNGAIGTINFSINSYQKNMEGSITIFGEKGTVKVGGQYLNKLEYQCIQDYEIKDLTEGNPANNYGDYQGSMSNHGEVYKNIVDVLTKNGKIATSGIEGMKTVEIIDKIYSKAMLRKSLRGIL